jgi:hypothetical protein
MSSDVGGRNSELAGMDMEGQGMQLPLLESTMIGQSRAPASESIKERTDV